MKTIGIAILLAGAASSGIGGGLIDFGWGLSPSEVATRSGGKAPEGSSAAWAMPGKYKLGNVGTTMLMGEEMNAGFYYIEDALAQVRMAKNTPCPAMRDTLKAKFGAPIDEADFPSGYSATWRDEASSTEVRHFASGECKVFLIRID